MRAVAATTVVAAVGCRASEGAADEGVREPRSLVVRHATVLDTRTARTLPDRAIVMRSDRIVQVVADSD